MTMRLSSFIRISPSIVLRGSTEELDATVALWLTLSGMVRILVVGSPVMHQGNESDIVLTYMKHQPS